MSNVERKNGTTPEPSDRADARDQSSTVQLLLPRDQSQTVGVPPSTIDSALSELITDPQRRGFSALLRLVTTWVRDDRNLRETIANYRVENAQLKVANDERRRHRPLVILALALGPILFAIGVDLIKSEHYGIGWAIALCAIAFLGVGLWVGEFIGTKGRGK